MNKKQLTLVAVLATAALVGAGCTSDTDATATTIPTTSTQSTQTSTTTSTTSTTATDTDEAIELTSHTSTHYTASTVEWDASSATEIAETDNLVTITEGGTYILSGTYTGGVLVESEDNELVQLVLNNATISSDTGAAIYIQQSAETVIINPTGTRNTVTDANTYTDTTEEAPTGAIDSNDNLTIAGSGTLTVTGNAGDGIVGNDGLVIVDTQIVVTAADEGIRGKDYLLVDSAGITITAGGDGMQSDNDSGDGTGFIAIENSSITIDADYDGISAYMDVAIATSTIDITAGGGSSSTVGSTESAKGIKAGALIAIDSGTIVIDSADDSLHSNNEINLTGGTFTIASGDDGIHADEQITISDGVYTVTESYEAIESAVIEISGGTFDLTASDDGINVAGGADASGMQGGPGRGGMMDSQFADSGDYYLTISGGNITVNAQGDGLDANGSITMTGGTVLVYGPSNSGNGPLDYDGSYTHTGGSIIAIGSSGMAMAASSSEQAMLLANFDTSYAAGTTITVESNGTVIATANPTRQYQSVLISQPDMEVGDTVEILVDGSVVETVELTDTITTSGSTGMGGGRGGMAPGARTF